MRTGIRIGVDVGSVRIGIARSDPDGTLAVPVTTVKAGQRDVEEIAALVAEYEALEVLVGVPLSMSGKPRRAAKTATEFAQRLAVAVAPVDVRLIDERLTTVQAQRGLTESGISTRQGKYVVDQAAAAIIVQHSLDAERASGEAPGMIIRTP